MAWCAPQPMTTDVEAFRGPLGHAEPTAQKGLAPSPATSSQHSKFCIGAQGIGDTRPSSGSAGVLLDQSRAFRVVDWISGSGSCPKVRLMQRTPGFCASSIHRLPPRGRQGLRQNVARHLCSGNTFVC